MNGRQGRTARSLGAVYDIDNNLSYIIAGGEGTYNEYIDQRSKGEN